MLSAARQPSIILLVLPMFLAVFMQGTLLAHGGDVDLTVHYENLDRTVLHYEINDFASEMLTLDGKDYLSISLDQGGCFRMDQAGHPQLPMLSASLLIPDQARMEVNILGSHYRDIHVEHGLVPFRGPISRTVDPSTVPYEFGEVYEQDAWFPSKPARLRAPYILRDVRGAVLEVCPFQYHPMKKILRVHTLLEVEVVNAGPGQFNVMHRESIPDRSDRSFEALYMNHFVNYGGSRTEPPTEDGDMLVICHGPFMSAMEPFVDWKNSIGLNTSIVDVAVIGNDRDDIMAYITDRYNTTNLAYVLLVGDADEVDPGYYLGWSDPNYATITPDWYPDLFVGRFSASTVGHVETQVQRTLEYEQQSHHVSLGGWHAVAMGIASIQGAGAGHYGESDDAHVTLIRHELTDYGFTKVYRVFDPFGTKSMISDGINEGCRLVNYTGHGSTTSWGTTGFSNSNVNALTNVGKLPFISSVACVNGNFGSANTCFAEAWMRATHSGNGEPTGAVACYMSSINQSWAEPMYAQGNHTHNSKLGAAERFWMETSWSIAAMWFGGSCIMMDICGNAGRNMFMTWICFGDPSLRIHGVPEEKVFQADGWALALGTPTEIHFDLNLGSDHGGDQYFILGSCSGTYPGWSLPKGLVLPLNFDVLTAFLLDNPNTPVFQNFYGVLDGGGAATAMLSTNGLTPLDPILSGTAFYFAALVWPKGKPFELATNVRIVTIVP